MLDVFYLVGNFPLTGVFFVWLYRRSRGRLRPVPERVPRWRRRLAFVVEWRFPTAPPRVAGVGVEDTLRRYPGVDIGSPGSGGLTDPVAAMPSLHAGWALGVGLGLLLYARTPVWKAVGVVYPLVVVVTTIVTGNHFLLDAAAGMAVFGVGFLLTIPPQTG